ncbi:MAG: hypothetical protein LDL44_03665, partial [Caenispirillum sp.]|nr:hypothetical protein [Caenispirillum sp.]
YREKVDELRGYRAAAEPDPSDYPLMAAEATARGISLAAQADMIEAAYTAWRQIGAALAAIEAGAVAAIEAAESPGAVRGVWDAIDWAGTAPD